MKEILEDIDEVAENLGVDGKSKELPVNVRDTLSDKASTENTFNDLLDKYREEL